MIDDKAEHSDSVVPDAVDDETDADTDYDITILLVK